MNHFSLILLCLLAFFFLKKIFFDNTDYKAMISNGGIIIDVRSDAEFNTRYIESSLNIPMGDFPSSLDYLKAKDQVFITCCASEIRSADAQKLLSAKGYNNIVNVGGLSNLKSKLGN